MDVFRANRIFPLATTSKDGEPKCCSQGEVFLFYDLAGFSTGAATIRISIALIQFTTTVQT
jgi:hypothetical protein